MQVVVQITPSDAQLTRTKGRKRGVVSAARKAAAELGADWRPMHPGAKDPTLASYYVAEAPNAATAERVAARLRELPGVHAYVKPADEPP